jgi:hypothetical protein
MGSPGMEGGSPVEYDVILFARDRQEIFGRYKADQPISLTDFIGGQAPSDTTVAAAYFFRNWSRLTTLALLS